jgi:hypothetical protein
MMDEKFKFNDLQIESIIDRLVPLVAAPEDHEFFRGVLRIKAEACTSGHFAHFVNELLKAVPEADAATIR